MCFITLKWSDDAVPMPLIRFKTLLISFVRDTEYKFVPIPMDTTWASMMFANLTSANVRTAAIKNPAGFFQSKGNLRKKIKIPTTTEDWRWNSLPVVAYHMGMANSNASFPISVEKKMKKLTMALGNIRHGTVTVTTTKCMSSPRFSIASMVSS